MMLAGFSLALCMHTASAQNPDALYRAGDTLWMRPTITIIGIAENGTKLLSGSFPDVVLFDPSTGNELYRLEDVRPTNTYTSNHPNLRYACFNSYVPNKPGVIWKVYDLDERRIIYEKYSADTMFIQGMAIDHDRIVVGYPTRGSLLIKMSSGDTITTLRGGAIRVDDETGKAYMMNGVVLDIVNLADGRVEKTYSTPAVAHPRQLTVSKDGRYVIYTLNSSTNHNSILAIDVTTDSIEDISSILGYDKGYWCCAEKGMLLQRDEEGRFVYLSGMQSIVDQSSVVLRFDLQTLEEEVILFGSIDQPPLFTDATWVNFDAKRLNLLYVSKVQNLERHTVCRSLSSVSSVAVGAQESQRIHIESDATQLLVHVDGADVNGHVSLTLYDMQGRVVKEVALSDDGRAIVPIEDLVCGTYIATCEIKGQRHSRSVVLSR
jgi:hypothetical protein